MVRIAVRTITFNILKYHEQTNLNKYIKQKFGIPYFIYLIKCIKIEFDIIVQNIKRIDELIFNSCNSNISLEIRKSLSIDRGISLKNEINILVEQVENSFYKLNEYIDYISDLLGVLSDDLSNILKIIFIEELIINTCFKNISQNMMYLYLIWYMYELLNDNLLKNDLKSLLFFKNYTFEVINNKNIY